MSLTGGDESNAVVEALDSVNLMTVHAAKGLEFPIVFVVNLAKGASGPPKPVRVSVDIHEEPSVSVGPFISDTDEAERERERHETRRLLYVAVTRARDRLYLSSTLKEGTLVPGRGSLAEVLPESCRKLLGRAATELSRSWTLSAGPACRAVNTPGGCCRSASDRGRNSSRDRCRCGGDRNRGRRLRITRVRAAS